MNLDEEKILPASLSDASSEHLIVEETGDNEVESLPDKKPSCISIKIDLNNESEFNLVVKLYLLCVTFELCILSWRCRNRRPGPAKSIGKCGI